MPAALIFIGLFIWFVSLATTNKHFFRRLTYEENYQIALQRIKEKNGRHRGGLRHTRQHIIGIMPLNHNDSSGIGIGLEL